MSQQPPLHPAPDPFNRIPAEVLRLIISQFCGHCCGEYKQPFWVSDSVQDTTTLYNLCLVSQHFRDVSQPIFFHLFGIDNILNQSSKKASWRLEPFLRTVAARLDLGRAVKIASVDWEAFNDLSFDGGKYLFDCCVKSLGTSAFSVFLSPYSDPDPYTNAIRESLLLRGPVPKDVKPEKYLPIVCAEILAVMLALLPNLTYLGFMENAGYIENRTTLERRGQRVDVSVPTLNALGVKTLALKSLESDYEMPKLLSRATNLESFITCGDVDEEFPEMPSLKSLHICRYGTLFQTLGCLPQCTGKLTSFSYTTRRPDIPTVVKYLEQKGFQESLESIRFGFREKHYRGAGHPLPSLKSFTKLKKLVLPTLAIYNSYYGKRPQSLIDILPPSIEVLTVVECRSSPAPPGLLYQDLLRLIEQKATSFTYLRRVISNSNHMCGPDMKSTFKQVDIALIYQEFTGVARRFSAKSMWENVEDFQSDNSIDYSHRAYPLPSELSDDDL